MTIDISNMINEYNIYMKGVNFVNQRIAYYAYPHNLNNGENLY